MSKLLDTQVDPAGDLILTRNDVEVARLDSSNNITTKGSVNGGSLSPIFNVVQLYGADNTGAGDTTAQIQAALDACNAAGGGIVYFPAGLYRHSGLTVGPKTTMLGAQRDATILRLNGGSNRPSIKSLNYDTLVGGSTQRWNDGTPYGIGFENLLIEGNKLSQNGTKVSHAFALFAFRCSFRNVYIYDHDGDGIHWQSVGPGSSTGTYPEAELESIIENICVRNCSGAGMYYRGPTDAYADRIFIAPNDGIGLDVSSMDIGYAHVYGCLQGVVLNGDCRIAHLETENNVNEGLVANVTGGLTNSISRLTCFDNWTSGTAGNTNYSVDLLGTCELGDVMIRCANGGSGLHMSTNADYSSVASGKIVGKATSVGFGVHCQANYVNIDVDISTFSQGFLFGFSHDSGRNLKLRITACPLGFFDNGGAPSDGHHIDVSYEATSNTYVPWQFSWAFGSTPSRSFYRLVSWNQIVTSFISDPTGVIDSRNTLDSGQGTIQRRDANSSLGLTSGWVTLTYFTARKFETVNNIIGFTGAAAAGATPTLCRMGLYSVASNGDLTLVASCVNDTALFAATATAYSRALSVPLALVAGKRYAFAYIIVTGAALPSIPGLFFPGPGSELTTTGPTESSHISGQTDLPGSIAVGSLAATQIMLYGKVTP